MPPKQPPSKGRGSGTSTPKDDVRTPGASGGATPPQGLPPIDLVEKYKEIVQQLRVQVEGNRN